MALPGKFGLANGANHGVSPAGKGNCMPQKPRNNCQKKPRLERDKAMQFATVAAWNWDTETGDAEFSPEWGDLFAVDPAKLGSNIAYLQGRLRDSDEKLFEKTVADIVSGKKDSLDMAVRLRRFDNTWAWVLLRGKAETNGLFSGVGMEVSRLRLDKRFFPPSLDDSQTTYQNILEHLPHNIVRFDRELFPLYTNPAVAMFIPCEPEDLGAKKVAEIGTDIDDLKFIQDQVNKVYASGEVVKARRTVVTMHGNIVGDFTFWPEFDSTGAVRSVLSLQQDLTAEVVLEREARVNEARFSALYQLTQMNDAPEKDVLRFVVEKIAELTGSSHAHLHFFRGTIEKDGVIVWSKSHDEIFDREYYDTFDPSYVKSEFGMGEPFSIEPAVPIFQNEPVPNQSNAIFGGKLPIRRYLCAPANEDGEPMCVAVVYNKKEAYTEQDMRQLQTFINGAWLVLRRRSYVAELKKAKEGAETANKVKDRFLANVSHELRTPLNGMLSMLQLLEFSNLTAEQAEYASSATNTGQTLLRIISDILDFSKMESGRIELANAPFGLKACLESAVALFQADAQKRGLGLKLVLAGEFPWVHGDEARVRQIVFNLVGNALKFTEEGEVEVFCEVRPAGERKVNIHLSVRDTGIGIPPDMQSRVFEAFTQVDGSSTRKHQGSGLGLGIVRQLTRIMGGTVALSSFPGRGTLVECVLPFQTVPESRLDENTVALITENEPPECPSLAVLVAEDDAVSRMAMRLFLERLGHRTVCVANGREALEALRVYPFDCLISDVLMPEMDGLEVTKHIREGLADAVPVSKAIVEAVGAVFPSEAAYSRPIPVPRDLPIIAVSAHAMKGDREHFLAQGMDYYLSKPVKINDLAAMLLRANVQKKSVSERVAGRLPWDV